MVTLFLRAFNVRLRVHHEIICREQEGGRSRRVSVTVAGTSCLHDAVLLCLAKTTRSSAWDAQERLDILAKSYSQHTLYHLYFSSFLRKLLRQIRLFV